MRGLVAFASIRFHHVHTLLLLLGLFACDSGWFGSIVFVIMLLQWRPRSLKCLARRQLVTSGTWWNRTYVRVCVFRCPAVAHAAFLSIGHAGAVCVTRSVGCTIVELITTKPPYFDLRPMTALFRIVSDDYPPLPSQCSEVRCTSSIARPMCPHVPDSP